jgi:thermitase
MVSMNVSSHRLWLSAAFAVALASLGAAQTGSQTSLDYVPGQVIVKFRPGFAGTSRTTHAMINARVKGEISAIGTQTIQLRPGMTVDQALKYYRSLAGVQSVTPNYRRHAFFTPNDPSYNNQWWLKKVNAPAAWDIHLGGPTTKIAIIDSGVNYNHEDLKGKVILGRDTVNNDNDPLDDDGHGTHVAGIAAANTNNGVGIAGLGFNCQIIAVKVLGPDGGTSDMTAQGIINAVDLGAQVINMSLGGEGFTDAEKDAVDYAISKDVVVIAAAGNDSVTTESYPAAFPGVIAVAATDQNDQRSDFSNYGADWVDVAAPGSGILSTVMNGSYENNDGTSMASPVVAGLAGLLRSYAPGVDALEVRNIIERTSVPVGDFIAYGRIDAAAALSEIKPPVEIEGFVSDAWIHTEGSLAQGRTMLGNVSDLKLADNKSVTVDTIYVPGNGSMASAQFTIDLAADQTNMIDANLTVRHMSRREATNSVFLYNYRTGKFDLIKSTPGQLMAVSTTFALPRKIEDYLADGQIRAVVRAYVSSRASKSATSFRLSIDQVKAVARIRGE